MQDTKTMFFIYLVENGMNVALAFALFPTFGVQGLAASFSLAYAGGCLVALRCLRPRIGGFREGRLGTMLYRITIAALLMADLAKGVSNLLARVLGMAAGLALVVRVAAAVMVGVTVYVQLTRTFGVEEVGSLLHLRRRPPP
jgi:peptidoglycan biosynthesis protein MviN/MurJ (putative lipid II flippase)